LAPARLVGYFAQVNITANADRFCSRIVDFRPDHSARTRVLGLYSAAIALADTKALDLCIRAAQNDGASRDELHEIVLQSYLFLGFPRMLEAAEHLNKTLPVKAHCQASPPITAKEMPLWLSRGQELYQRVYGSNHDVLRKRVEALAPEIFQWMLLEGYGKTLSRPGLSVVDREAAIVACLMMENRSRQLHSHIRGALNVGAKRIVIETLIHDIGNAAGDGYKTALDLLMRIKD
jgi:4-carboxymuconolactone decarboxylase